MQTIRTVLLLCFVGAGSIVGLPQTSDPAKDKIRRPQAEMYGATDPSDTLSILAALALKLKTS